MSLSFKYEARGPSGRIERGAVEAASRADALGRLKQRNLTPFALSAAPAGGSSRLDTIAARDLCRTLAQLLRAGLSVSQALRFAGEELPPKSAAAASRMREAAERGEPPSQALQDFTGPEARLLVGIIRAGEESGRLTEALERAAQSFTRAAAMRARIGTALIYPSFVILATLATLACFLFLVVPSLAQAFEGAEERLPASTRSLLALSALLKANGLLVVLALVALIGYCAASAGARRLLAGAADMLMASPLGFGVAERLDYAAFAGLAALSLKAGAPATDAFETALGAVRNRRFQAGLSAAASAIRTGERPSLAFDRLARAPKSFVRLGKV